MVLEPEPAEQRDAAFTLVELLVVMLVVAVLAALAVPVYLSQRIQAYDTAAKAELRGIATSQQLHAADHPGYTPDRAALEAVGLRPSQPFAGTADASTSPRTPGTWIETTATGDGWCAYVIHPNRLDRPWAESDASGSPVAGATCDGSGRLAP